MKVLVCGGRDFDDERLLSDTLCDLHKQRPFTLLIHGAARGADTLAAGWALDMGIEAMAMPADWDAHGRKAGILRNIEMLKEKPELVVAFPGGRGTADMVARAKKACIPVVEVSPLCSKEQEK